MAHHPLGRRQEVSAARVREDSACGWAGAVGGAHRASLRRLASGRILRVIGTARWRDRLAHGGAIALLGTLAALPDPSFWMRLLLAVVALVVGLGRANWQRGALALLLCAGLVTIGTAAGEM